MVHSKADPALWERSFECSAIGVLRRRQKKSRGAARRGISEETGALFHFGIIVGVRTERIGGEAGAVLKIAVAAIARITVTDVFRIRNLRGTDDNRVAVYFRIRPDKTFIRSGNRECAGSLAVGSLESFRMPETHSHRAAFRCR